MTTRIRYRKFLNSDTEVLQSVKIFQHPDNGARYKIQIIPSELQYRIVEDMSDSIVLSGRAVNLHQVKIKAKKAIESLGITFQAEGRDRQETQGEDYPLLDGSTSN